MKHPLSIVKVENSKSKTGKPLSKLRKREEIENYFEELWRKNPHIFDPLRNVKERERLDRSMRLIELELGENHHAADLGCGGGVFSKRLIDNGIKKVTGVDAATLALKKLAQETLGLNVEAKHDCVPNTTLDDDSFDLVVALELLAYLKPEDYRLFFAEIARIMQKKSKALISTPIDFRSYDALHRFLELAETELLIKKIELSHFSLYIKLKDVFKAPQRFYDSSKDPELRKKALHYRQGLLKKWFQLNSTNVLAPFWKIVSYATKPIVNMINNSRSCLLYLEKVAKFFNNDNSISHAIILAERKPLVEVSEKDAPIVRKGKHEVWE